MKTKTTVFITVLITVAILLGGYFVSQYMVESLEKAYDNGFQEGNLGGLLYTQQSGGDIVFMKNDGNLTIIGMPEECKAWIGNELNQQQGS